jgi:hypothetical protein
LAIGEDSLPFLCAAAPRLLPHPLSPSPSRARHRPRRQACLPTSAGGPSHPSCGPGANPAAAAAAADSGGSNSGDDDRGNGQGDDDGHGIDEEEDPLAAVSVVRSDRACVRFGLHPAAAVALVADESCLLGWPPYREGGRAAGGAACGGTEPLGPPAVGPGGAGLQAFKEWREQVSARLRGGAARKRPGTDA